MDIVSLSNYQDFNFDGFADQQAADQLFKAMQAGNITGRDAADQLLTMEPLKAESLEKTLKSIEFREKDIQLWNAFPKLPANNTVEEFLLLASYGSDRGGFYNEGELSDVEDSKYIRKSELVKYIQVTGEVTYQAQIVKGFVNAMNQEIANKTQWVVRKANAALTKADSKIVPQEWNGVYAQHASIGSGETDLYTTLDAYLSSDVVIDLRGKALTQEDVENASIAIDANFGAVDRLFAPPSVISGLSKEHFDQQRIMMGASAVRQTAGVNLKAIDTSMGEVALAHDKFMKKDPKKTLASIATSLKAPNKPTFSDASLVSDAAASKFTTAEGGLGTVFYAISAVNRYGESALAVIDNTTKVTLTNAQSVDLSFTDGGGAVPATGYVIYRSKVTAATNASTQAVEFYPLFKVSVAQKAAGYDGGAAGVVRDRNRWLPDTEEGFMTEMVEEVMSFKQLAPLSKMDLAVLGMSKRFITFMFGTPQLYTPKKMVRFINIGKYVKAS